MARLPLSPRTTNGGNNGGSSSGYQRTSKSKSKSNMVPANGNVRNIRSSWEKTGVTGSVAQSSPAASAASSSSWKAKGILSSRYQESSSSNNNNNNNSNNSNNSNNNSSSAKTNLSVTTTRSTDENNNGVTDSTNNNFDNYEDDNDENENSNQVNHVKDPVKALSSKSDSYIRKWQLPSSSSTTTSPAKKKKTTPSALLLPLSPSPSMMSVSSSPRFKFKVATSPSNKLSNKSSNNMNNMPPSSPSKRRFVPNRDSPTWKSLQKKQRESPKNEFDDDIDLNDFFSGARDDATTEFEASSVPSVAAAAASCSTTAVNNNNTMEPVIHSKMLEYTSAQNNYDHITPKSNNGNNNGNHNNNGNINRHHQGGATPTRTPTRTPLFQSTLPRPSQPSTIPPRPLSLRNNDATNGANIITAISSDDTSESNDVASSTSFHRHHRHHWSLEKSSSRGGDGKEVKQQDNSMSDLAAALAAAEATVNAASSNDDDDDNRDDHNHSDNHNHNDNEDIATCPSDDSNSNSSASSSLIYSLGDNTIKSLSELSNKLSSYSSSLQGSGSGGGSGGGGGGNSETFSPKSHQNHHHQNHHRLKSLPGQQRHHRSGAGAGVATSTPNASSMDVQAMVVFGNNGGNNNNNNDDDDDHANNDMDRNERAKGDEARAFPDEGNDDDDDDKDPVTDDDDDDVDVTADDVAMTLAECRLLLEMSPPPTPISKGFVGFSPSPSPSNGFRLLSSSSPSSNNNNGNNTNNTKNSIKNTNNNNTNNNIKIANNNNKINNIKSNNDDDNEDENARAVEQQQFHHGAIVVRPSLSTRAMVVREKHDIVDLRTPRIVGHGGNNGDRRISKSEVENGVERDGEERRRRQRQRAVLRPHGESRRMLLAIAPAPHVDDRGDDERIAEREVKDGVENGSNDGSNNNSIVSYTSNHSGGSRGFANRSLRNDGGGSGGSSRGFANRSLATSSASIISSDVAKFLTCPTCNREFAEEDEERRPLHSFGCDHIVCHGCVFARSGGGGNGRVACPECGVRDAFDTDRPVVSRAYLTLIRRMRSDNSNNGNGSSKGNGALSFVSSTGRAARQQRLVPSQICVPSPKANPNHQREKEEGRDEEEEEEEEGEENGEENVSLASSKSSAISKLSYMSRHNLPNLTIDVGMSEIASDQLIAVSAVATDGGDTTTQSGRNKEGRDDEETYSASMVLLPTQSASSDVAPDDDVEAPNTPRTPTTPVSRAEYHFHQRKEKLAKSLEKVNQILQRSKVNRVASGAAATVPFDVLEEEEEEENESHASDGESIAMSKNVQEFFDSDRIEIGDLDMDASRASTMPGEGNPDDERNVNNSAEDDDDVIISDDVQTDEDFQLQVATTCEVSRLMTQLRNDKEASLQVIAESDSSVDDEKAQQSPANNTTSISAKSRLKKELRVDTGESLLARDKVTRDAMQQPQLSEKDEGVDGDGEGDDSVVGRGKAELRVETSEALSPSVLLGDRNATRLDVDEVVRQIREEAADSSVASKGNVVGDIITSPAIDSANVSSANKQRQKADSFMDIFRTFDGYKSQDATANNGTPSLIEFGFGTNMLAPSNSNDSSLTGDKDDTSFLLSKHSFSNPGAAATSKEDIYSGIMGNGHSRLAQIRKGRIKGSINPFDYKISIKGASSFMSSDNEHHQQENHCPQFLPSLNYSTMHESDEFVGLVMSDDKAPSPMWGGGRGGTAMPLSTTNSRASTKSAKSAAIMVKRMRNTIRKQSLGGSGGGATPKFFEKFGQSLEHQEQQYWKSGFDCVGNNREVEEESPPSSKPEPLGQRTPNQPNKKGPTYDFCVHSCSISETDGDEQADAGIGGGGEPLNGSLVTHKPGRFHKKIFKRFRGMTKGRKSVS